MNFLMLYYMSAIPEIINVAVSGILVADEILKNEKVQGCFRQLFQCLMKKFKKQKIVEDLKI